MQQIIYLVMIWKLISFDSSVENDLGLEVQVQNGVDISDRRFYWRVNQCQIIAE